MSNFPSLNEQMDIIRSGVEEIIPEAELVKKIEKSIANKAPLKIKCGCDPSRPDLHIGHAVLLRKMRQFQDIGHQAILLIGDFTAMIGDPTGRNKTRPQITIEDTKLNAQSYIDQASIILDKSTLDIVYNSDWLGKMDFSDVIKLASKYTVARMLERDDFTKRYNGGVPISLHEFLYPLAQGYDSVHLNADVELGGTDQKFNLLVGRDLQKESGQTPQVVITTVLLEGTDGVEKMSKSYDNYIAFNDTPNDMYGKIMSISDELMFKYYDLVTNIGLKEIEDYKIMLKTDKINYRDLKRKLAREIITIYYDSAIASQAEQHFINVFVKKVAPDDIKIVKINKTIKLVEFLVEQKLVSSKGECKRLIKQSGIKLDNVPLSDINYELNTDSSMTIKIGKRKFIKVG